MDIIESMIFDQSKASEGEAAQRCRFHPKVRPPVVVNRGMVHSRAPLSRRRQLNGFELSGASTSHQFDFRPSSGVRLSELLARPFPT